MCIIDAYGCYLFDCSIIYNIGCVDMGYICPSCGKWVWDNQSHSCTYDTDNSWKGGNMGYWCPPISYTPSRIVKCKKKHCIYWTAVSLYSQADECDGYCGNQSLMLDEFGNCRCYVKEVGENDTAKE